MLRAEIPIEGELAEELAESIRQGPIIDDAGRRLLNEVLVDKIEGLKITIRAVEHPPPHFHVECQGQSASFSIADGTRLRGVFGLEKHERNIKAWWVKNKKLLIRKWNSSRPTDCPVGPIPVSQSN